MYVSPRPRRATPGDCAACAAACPDPRCRRPARCAPPSPGVTGLPPPFETQLGTPSPALAAATTHACFSPSCDSFFPSEPSSGGASLSCPLPPPPSPLLVLLPLPSLVCASFFSRHSSFLFIHIYLAPALFLPFPPSLRIPALSRERLVGGSAAGQA